MMDIKTDSREAYEAGLADGYESLEVEASSYAAKAMDKEEYARLHRMWLLGALYEFHRDLIDRLAYINEKAMAGMIVTSDIREVIEMLRGGTDKEI